MFAAVEVIPPMTYEPFWLILGISLVVLVVLWLVLVVYVTRKRALPTLTSAGMRAEHVVNLAEIQARYLQLFDQINAQYTERKINAREAHARLSYTARYFVYEVTGRPTHRMTLTDLEKTAFKEVREIVRGIYPPEFAKMQAGDVPSVVQKCKRMVQSWR
jgi:hypothetical protein